MKTELRKNEKVILSLNPNTATLIGPWMLFVFFLISGLVGGGVWWLFTVLFGLILIYAIIARRKKLWIVTNQRIIAEHGVISIHSKDVSLHMINNLTYNQSLSGRMFGYGSIEIQSAAEAGAIQYNFVNEPKKLKKVISDVQEEYRQQQLKEQATEYSNMVTKAKSSSSDASTEIEKLFAMKEKGILTEEEFVARKKKILES